MFHSVKFIANGEVRREKIVTEPLRPTLLRAVTVGSVFLSVPFRSPFVRCEVRQRKWKVVRSG